jgi:integrase
MAVRRRGERWYYDFMIRRTRYRQCIPEARTRKQAQRAEVMAREAIFNEKYGIKVTPRLADFLRDIYLPWARTNKLSWRNDYSRAKPLIAAFGNLRLAEISTFHLERYKVKRLGEQTKRGTLPANVTVNHELKVLSRAYTLAIDQNLTEVNPCRRVRHLREEPGRTRYLSPEEQERLMAALVGELTYLRTIVTIALLTGMRQGEIYGLRWEQLDFGRSTITLTRTKSGRTRIIPMSEGVRGELLELDPQAEGWVFPGATGKNHFCHSGIHWRRACDRAGLDDFRFHDLRHVAATRLAESGTADAFTIAAILGHTNVAMTQRYVNSTSGAMRSAMEALVTKFQGNGREFVAGANRAVIEKEAKTMSG